MEKIGIIREIDNLGRLCIPKEMRKMFNMDNKVEIVAVPEGILVKNPEYIGKKRKGCLNSSILFFFYLITVSPAFI